VSLTLKSIDKELKRRERASQVPDLLDHNFKAQTAFITDPSRLKVAFCTRRAGKSMGAARYLFKEGLENPGVNLLYLALTRDSAKKILWKDCLKVLNRQYGLKCKFNETTLTCTLPNGSVIYVLGIDSDEEEKQKLLGQKYRLAIIDECASMGVDLNELIYGILKPSVADLNGTICMIGTPGNIIRGLFFDITTVGKPGWIVHKWDTFQNPYMAKQWQADIDEQIANNPLVVETPLFKQHYLGKWFVDTDKLVYKFSVERNVFKELPKGLKKDGWTYVLGVDTGWEDDNAFVLTAYHENDPNLYVIRTFNKPHMTFDDVAKKIGEFQQDTTYAPHKIIVDGANKQGVESMKSRSQIPFEYADKQDKVTFIELMNSDFILGNIKVHESCTTLIKEWSALIWVTEGERIKLPKKEHPGLPNHLCDAALYSWRNGFHYASETVIPKKVYGSAEWYAEQSTQIWEREREHLEKQDQQGQWVAEGDWPSQG